MDQDEMERVAKSSAVTVAKELMRGAVKYTAAHHPEALANDQTMNRLMQKLREAVPMTTKKALDDCEAAVKANMKEAAAATFMLTFALAGINVAKDFFIAEMES